MAKNATVKMAVVICATRIVLPPISETEAAGRGIRKSAPDFNWYKTNKTYGRQPGEKKDRFKKEPATIVARQLPLGFPPGYYQGCDGDGRQHV